MDQTTLDALEFPAVLRSLSGYAASPLGAELALGLRPVADIAHISERFSEFDEMRDMLAAVPRLPLGSATDIRPLIKKAAPRGAHLSGEEFLAIRENLEVARRLKNFQGGQRDFPRIAQITGGIEGQPALRTELKRIFDEKGEMKDDASPELYRIRGEMRASKSKAKSILDAISRDERYKHLLQEDFITIRDDRYVLAIRAEKHTALKGVVHGRSGSGASFFVEPFQVVELNNSLMLLKKEEAAEELEILRETTRMVSEEKDSILSDLGIIARLDCLQAKVLFAEKLRARAPELKARGEVVFKSARHPLLAIEEEKGTGAVVPVDIEIKDGCRVLVISGANTGGKTVALKTLGLLTLMALSGIPVPVEEGSVVVVFSSVFSDIGDRQDIIASLSTFSAHVKRLCEFLELAGPGSLVLMDEIGAGTDPAEGGALALAALEAFKDKGAIVAVTTHLNLIKAHAQVDPAYQNASVEFDDRTLRPLYRLHYGVPGPSLGLSIAESLGVPATLIEKARENLKEKEAAFVESIKDLEREKEELAELKERLGTLEDERAKAVERLRNERRELIKKAGSRIDGIVQGARAEILKAVERAETERSAGKKSKAARASEAEDLVSEAVSRAEKLLGVERSVYEPSPGDRAGIIGSRTKGVVLTVDRDEKKAELQVGAMKIRLPWDRLERVEGGRPGYAATERKTGIDADVEAERTLNIIGMRVEEALKKLARFLDNAHAGGLDVVEVIHGVGTGALSKAVTEYLAVSPLVREFRHGDTLRGGAGVTEVVLR